MLTTVKLKMIALFLLLFLKPLVQARSLVNSDENFLSNKSQVEASLYKGVIKGNVTDDSATNKSSIVKRESLFYQSTGK